MKILTMNAIVPKVPLSLKILWSKFSFYKQPRSPLQLTSYLQCRELPLMRNWIHIEIYYFQEFQLERLSPFYKGQSASKEEATRPRLCTPATQRDHLGIWCKVISGWWLHVPESSQIFLNPCKRVSVEEATRWIAQAYRSVSDKLLGSHSSLSFPPSVKFPRKIFGE